ncbi:MAG: NADH-quinone oxidoreductase subunit C [Magnetococcus sp. DMHC-6]
MSTENGSIQSKLEQQVANKFPQIEREWLGDALVLRVEPAGLLSVMQGLRDDPELDFKMLIDIAGVHYPTRNPEFDVVYQLLSVYKNHRIRIKVGVKEQEAVPSVTGVWSCANWYEREAYDLFGILFSGHPDLRRILNDYDFEGHPLRKDFPLSGEYEVRYDDALGRVVREPVNLKRPDREAYRQM